MSQSTVKVDGRVERTSATRNNILAMTRELILEGMVDPTARQIAERAGITTRTLFRHFPDMESLYRSFIEAAEAQATAVMDESFPEGSPEQWQQLLQVVIDRRVRVYESLLPLYISAIWSKYRATPGDARRYKGTRRRRNRLKALLPEPIASDPILFEAIDGLLGIDYWVSLRRDQRLSVSKSSAVLRLALEKLIA